MTDIPPAPPVPLLPPHPIPFSPVIGVGAELNSDDNPHKLVARYRKARAIATVLLQLGADATAAETVADSTLARQLAARAANVNAPSATTWALVVELVREVRPS